jgi:DNA-binding response OmpR family regulator
MSFIESKKVKILIIEDDVFMQNVLNTYHKEFYETETVNNGIDALTFLQKGDLPNLIISDLNIPSMSGLEFIAQIKASGFFKAIPIMILSGEESSEMRIKCLNAGADDFIVKPFNPRELDARIQVILRWLEKTSTTQKNI